MTHLAPRTPICVEFLVQCPHHSNHHQKVLPVGVSLRIEFATKFMDRRLSNRQMAPDLDWIAQRDPELHCLTAEEAVAVP